MMGMYSRPRLKISSVCLSRHAADVRGRIVYISRSLSWPEANLWLCWNGAQSFILSLASVCIHCLRCDDSAPRVMSVCVCVAGHSVRLLGQKKEKGKRLGGARLDLPKIRKNPLIEIISINTG